MTLIYDAVDEGSIPSASTTLIGDKMKTRLVPPSIWTDRTVMVSGGFDPIHAGHVAMIRDAAKHGDVIVVANSDEWLMRKKGFVFMPFEECVKNLASKCFGELVGITNETLPQTSQKTLLRIIQRGHNEEVF